MAGEIQLSGNITGTPSTAGKCGLIIPPGIEPTVPEAGGVWYDTGDDAVGIFHADGTITYLPKGTGIAGQVLTSNGVDTVPTYQPAGGGILALQTVFNQGSAGPFVANNELQIANIFTFTAGVLNTVGRKLITKFNGIFTSAIAQVPTVDFSLEFAGTDIMTITSGALTASVTNAPFFLEYETIVVTAGAAGVVQSIAKLIIALAGGATFTTYYGSSTQVGAINLTSAAAGKPKLNGTTHTTALSSIVLKDAFFAVYPTSVP